MKMEIMKRDGRYVGVDTKLGGYNERLHSWAYLFLDGRGAY